MKVKIYASDETGNTEFDFENKMPLKEFNELILNILKKYPAK